MPYDVKLDANGDIYESTQVVTGDELIAQRIRIRLQTHLGEWLLDTSQGMPYIDWADTLPLPVTEVRQKILDELTTTPGVLTVTSLVVDVDNVLGCLSATASVLLDGGAVAEVVITDTASTNLPTGASDVSGSGRPVVLATIRGAII